MANMKDMGLPDDQRRDPDYTFVDEFTPEQEAHVRELIRRGESAELGLVGSPNIPTSLLLFLYEGEITLLHSISKKEALMLAQTLLDFAGIESYVVKIDPRKE